jgi:hypothetical protein
VTPTLPVEFKRWAEFMAANPSPADVVVGQHYWVPCAKPSIRWRNMIHYIPLLGMPHEDREFVGFHPWHVHIDTRFITIPPGEEREFLDALVPLTMSTTELASIWSHAQLAPRFLKARRTAAPEWPSDYAEFQQILEDKHAHCRVINGVCPHKAIALNTGRDVGNGVRQCPGHGLWWAADGSMVRHAGGGQ